MPDYDPIEQKIVDILQVLASHGYKKFTQDWEWTLGVTGIIGAIGWRNECSFGLKLVNENKKAFLIDVLKTIQEKLNYTLYDDERDRFVGPQYFGEFLYDIVWLKYDINYKNKHLCSAHDFKNKYNRFNLIDSPLTGESDWGDFGCVKEDFEKLLLARSKYRIMVFSVTDENQFNTYIRRLTELIHQYKRSQPSDRYLFCGKDKDKRIFRFDQFIVP